MERLINKELKKWKKSKQHKPLVVLGVRQCGKTYSIQNFGREEFEDVAYFNFEKNTSLESLFSYDLDVDRIISDLGSVIRGKEIIPGKTLVIFDEIQTSENAITSLKYFNENMPELHLIAAGSLLGVALKKKGMSFPVGKVQTLQMYPLSFEEYVMACGDYALIEGLKKLDRFREIPALYSEALAKHLKNYYIIGGMPEVVQKWLDTRSYEEVDRLQEQILSDYENDFGKYAPVSDIPKIRQIWHSIPNQLAKENNKFIFSQVKSGGRARDLEDALEWLIDAGLVYKQRLVEKPEVPLSYMADDTYFKVFLSDVGLLRNKSNVYYKTILEGDERYIRFKGALAENYVLTELVNQGLPYYFWRSDNQAEVDFLTEDKGYMIPLEVKSADNTHAKSFGQFISRYKTKYGFKVSLKNVGDNTVRDTQVISLPLYEMWRLRDYIE